MFLIRNKHLIFTGGEKLLEDHINVVKSLSCQFFNHFGLEWDLDTVENSSIRSLKPYSFLITNDISGFNKKIFFSILMFFQKDKNYKDYSFLMAHSFSYAFSMSFIASNSLNHSLGGFGKYELINGVLDYLKPYSLFFNSLKKPLNDSDLNRFVYCIINVFILENILKKKTISIEYTKKLTFFSVKMQNVPTSLKSVSNLKPSRTFEWLGSIYRVEFNILTIRNILSMNVIIHNKSYLAVGGVERLDSIKFFPDSNISDVNLKAYKKFFNILDKDWNYDQILLDLDNILVKINNLSKESRYKNIFEDFIKNMDFLDSKDLVDNIHKIRDDNTKNYFDFKNKFSNLSRLYSAQLERLLYFNLCEFNRFNSEGFYLPHHMDFRGRNYSRSFLSPINSKLARSSFFYGYYTESEFNNLEARLSQSTSHSLISQYFYLFDGLSLKNNRVLILTSLVWLFLELGKFEKVKLAVNGEVDMFAFIKLGLEIFNGKKILSFSEISDIFYYNKITYYIKEFINGNYLIKIYLLKDSTASVFQHLFRWMGIKEKKSLSICNLDGGNVWCDTYVKIILFFLKGEAINKYFMGRQYLKKPIMTTIYNVTYLTAWKEYKNSLGVGKLNKMDMLELEEFFKNFFNFLKNTFETSLLYEHNKTSFKGLGYKIKLDDNNILDLVYFTPISRRYEIKNKDLKLRQVMVELIRGGSIDKVMSERAFFANLIQGTDAYFARKVLDNFPIYVIHDEFLCTPQEVCFLIDEMNKIFCEDITKDGPLVIKNSDLMRGCFSNFIIL